MIMDTGFRDHTAVKRGLLRCSFDTSAYSQKSPQLTRPLEAHGLPAGKRRLMHVIPTGRLPGREECSHGDETHPRALCRSRTPLAFPSVLRFDDQLALTFATSPVARPGLAAQIHEPGWPPIRNGLRRLGDGLRRGGLSANGAFVSRWASASGQRPAAPKLARPWSGPWRRCDRDLMIQCNHGYV